MYRFEGAPQCTMPVYLEYEWVEKTSVCDGGSFHELSRARRDYHFSPGLLGLSLTLALL